MSGARFAKWQLYEMIEPFGERADYWRTGQICAAIQNANRTKKSDPIAKAEDFMPRTFATEKDSDAPAVDEFAELKAKMDSLRRS